MWNTDISCCWRATPSSDTYRPQTTHWRRCTGCHVLGARDAALSSRLSGGGPCGDRGRSFPRSSRCLRRSRERSRERLFLPFFSLRPRRRRLPLLRLLRRDFSGRRGFSGRAPRHTRGGAAAGGAGSTEGAGATASPAPAAGASFSSSSSDDSSVVSEELSDACRQSEV